MSVEGKQVGEDEKSASDLEYPCEQLKKQASQNCVKELSNHMKAKDFLGGSVVKNSPSSQGVGGRSLDP